MRDPFFIKVEKALRLELTSAMVFDNAAAARARVVGCLV
jgi:hypothetical protein